MDPRFQGLKAIFFDAGSTLIEEMTPYRQRVEAALKEKGLSRHYEDVLPVLKEAASLHESPYRYLAKKLGLNEAIPWDFSKESLFPGAQKLLQALYPHYRLGIIANQPPDFLKRVEKLKIASYFELIIGSEDVGMSKPSPAIFRYALAKMSLIGEQAMMIGDRLENDIAPAKALGMKTLWIRQGFARYQQTRSPADTPDASVDSLSAISSLLL